MNWIIEVMMIKEAVASSRIEGIEITDEQERQMIIDALMGRLDNNG